MSPSDIDAIGGEKASQVQLLNVQQVHLQFYTLKIDIVKYVQFGLNCFNSVLLVIRASKVRDNNLSPE